jgi:hypothetical protein
MRAWVIVVLLVITGIVGAWVGYWAGHAAGWTTDAEFPLRIGGGERAILLSILVSFASVMVGLWWLVGRPLRRERRLLASGTTGRARILRVWRTGLTTRRGGHAHQLAFEVEMHPEGAAAYRAKATGTLPEADEVGLRPGAEVVVRYDPAHPRSVVVVGPMTTPVSA